MLESRDVDVAPEAEATPEEAERLSRRMRAAAPDLAIIVSFIIFALLLIATALR